MAGDENLHRHLFFLLSDSLPRGEGEEEGPERTPEICATSLRNKMNRGHTSVESWMRPNIFNINRPPKADRPR